MAPARSLIPLTVVVGQLGAGKTTLINRLLSHPDFANTAVILNESGAVALEGGRVERANDGIIALGSGCICCVVRGELVEALERLLRDLDNHRIGALGRVVIEAAAAADPAAILTAVARHPYLSLRYRADGIIAVVDIERTDDLLAADADAVRQIAMADVVAVAKGERAARELVQSRLAKLNPGADLVDAASVAPSSVVRRGRFTSANTTPPQWLGATERDEEVAAEGGEAARIHAFTVVNERAMPAGVLERFLDYLAARQGSNLLRLKGVTRADEGEAIVFEGVGGLFYPPLLVAAGDQPRPAMQIHVVAHDLDRSAFETYLAAFLNEARIDTPDRQALVANPLAIAGFSARTGG